MRKAVIDVGSNSVLLLVAEGCDGRWRTVQESTAVTSLGEGAKTTGMLSEAGINRTLDALKRAFSKATSLGCEEIVAGATMAARIARNTPDFLARAAEQGTPVRVLSGDQEAELGLRSVLDDPEFQGHSRISVIDVGGQSSELVTADSGRVLFRRSFPIGTLGLRGDVLASERLGARELLMGVREIDETIGLEYLPDQNGATVVLGATGTNLITIRERMTDWRPERVHGQWLDYEEISRSVSWLGSLSDDERSSVVGIERGRERTLHIGALILERFLYAVHSLGCYVSVRGWRHALLETGLPADTNL